MKNNASRHDEKIIAYACFAFTILVFVLGLFYLYDWQYEMYRTLNKFQN